MAIDFLNKQYKDGVHVAALKRTGCTEYVISVQQDGGEDFAALCAVLARQLKEREATPVSLDVFGVPGEGRAQLQKALGTLPCPVTWLEGRRDRSAVHYGIQAWAVSGPEVVPLRVGPALAGVVFRADGLRYCRLGGLVAGKPAASDREQTAAVFDLMERALADVDMTFMNVVRTWFYNRNMLDWYDTFNAVRTAFFIKRGVFDHLVPASTGIGCWNGCDAALTSGVLAIADEEGKASPFSVPSPLQRPSFEYGSAFSRAVEFAAGGMRRLMISGTASIEPQGASVHIGDVRAQIALTLDVVQAILESREMDWSRVFRAIAYFKHAEDVAILTECMADRGMPPLPALLAHTDICRDDLLFELELDAAGR